MSWVLMALVPPAALPLLVPPLDEVVSSNVPAERVITSPSFAYAVLIIALLKIKENIVK